MKTTVTFTVHSLDAAGVARFFEEHGAEIRHTRYYGDWMGLLLGGALLILLELVLLR